MAPARFLLLCLAMAFPLALTGAEPIDGQTAAQWVPQPGFSPGKSASSYSVKDHDGALEFSAVGGVMTWTFNPTAAQLAGGKRYLLLRYQAQGVLPSGDYLLLGRDGSPDWRHYLTQRQLETDGAEHVLAVDFLAFLPPGNLDQFALRISSGAGQTARLDACLEFANELPKGAKVVGAPAGDRKAARVEFETLDWQASPSWVPRNSAEIHSSTNLGTVAQFSVSGEGRAMRWRAAAAPKIDLTAMPFLGLRYRAQGDFAPGNYVLQTYAIDDKGERKSVHLVTGRDLDTDGAWHVFRRRLDERGTTDGSLAVGIDCTGAPAGLEIDWIAFDSQPMRLAIADLLDFEAQSSAWPAGVKGLETQPAPKGDAGHLGPVALARFGMGEWFPSPHIRVGDVPFEVPPTLDSMAATGLVEEESIAVELPGGPAPKEILLLLAAEFPHREETLSKTPLGLPFLSEPERLLFSIESADGSVDEFLPIHAAKARYGVGHGLAVYAIRPVPNSQPRRLLLHDRMTNAGFAILGVTLNRDAPKIPEPEGPWFSPERNAPIADAAFRFSTQGGLAWDSIDSAMFGGAVALKGEPVFSLQIGDRNIPSTEWKIAKATTDATGSFQSECFWSEGKVSLSASFVAKRTDSRSALLSIDVKNTGAEPVTGALFFPKLGGVAIGSAEDTWYLACRTGGVINKLPCAWRDEIGEPHALPLDGFFNPRLGAGLSLMPRDLDGVFRWYCVGKDSRGGNYALEFLPRTVAPGGKWESVPVEVAAVAGDWRDQLARYRDWTKTWYRPAAPRKPWFAKVFGFPSYCPTEPVNRPLDQRVDLLGQAKKIEASLGYRDYIHLFGWAITPEHGHWGAYDEFHQLGGVERFAAEVRKSREAGVPVGVYLDGYLVATQAVKPSREQQEAWGIRTEDGKKLYHTSYDAHSMCPYSQEWRDYLSAVYRRVATQVRPDGMYLDEFGKCMTSRICWSKNHGHPVPMGMAPGEWTLSRDVRGAIPPEIAFYCEYVPADVGCQYLDGAFGHTALHGFRDDYDRWAPQYVNLQRFALPDFKVYELIYYSALKNGNWFLLKYPFFNGEGYYMTGFYWNADVRATAFLRNAFRVQHEHADVFTSQEVEPLVPTLAPGLYANRFSTPGKTVWTLLNANSRTLRGPLLAVPHRDKACYLDVWAGGKPVATEIQGHTATLSFEIGPKQVGCVVQERE